MKPVIFALIFFSVFSCKTSGLNEEIEYSYIVKKDYGGSETKSHTIIDNYTDLLKSVETINLTEEETDALVNIDFKNNKVLIAHIGQKNTGGYSISIDKMYNENGVLHIKLLETKPEKGGMVTMALTNPFFIAIIPKLSSIVVE